MARMLILLGPPGAGKGTQAARLGERLSFPHVSTGDLLRQHLRMGTTLAERARGYMDRGELVPDELVLEMLSERIEAADCGPGCVLDGFPRTLPQAESLEALLERRGERVRALDLEVPDEVLVERLTGRRVCRQDGAHIQHLRFSPPRIPGRCDRCGGELYQRSDDQAEVVQKRLEVYHRQTAPLLDFYARRGALTSIDGDRAPDAVLSDILRWAREAA